MMGHTYYGDPCPQSWNPNPQLVIPNVGAACFCKVAKFIRFRVCESTSERINGEDMRTKCTTCIHIPPLREAGRLDMIESHK